MRVLVFVGAGAVEDGFGDVEGCVAGFEEGDLPGEGAGGEGRAGGGTCGGCGFEEGGSEGEGGEGEGGG